MFFRLFQLLRLFRFFRLLRLFRFFRLFLHEAVRPGDGVLIVFHSFQKLKTISLDGRRIFHTIHFLHKHGQRPRVYLKGPVHRLIHYQHFACLAMFRQTAYLIQITFKMSVHFLWFGIMSHRNLLPHHYSLLV